MPSVGARAEAAAEAPDLEGCDLTNRSNAVQEAVPFSGTSGASSTRPAVSAQGGMGGEFSEGSKGQFIFDYETEAPYNRCVR